ncbi:MAG: nucleotidyl transferase AbiEii/AbiGii toxin family protein [Gaiellales bacterium]
MKYRDAAAFRQALEKRLKAQAGGDVARLARDRKRVAFDRLLARLDAVARSRWVLKGGFALDLRLSERARATRDIDIDWQADEEELADVLIEAAGHVSDDFFAFEIERAGTPPERLGGSYRFRVTASLAGRQFERFWLDVGVRPPPAEGCDMLTTPDLLAFAEIAPVEVQAVRLGRHVAEKVHAYTRRYGDDQPSSRSKDLIDIVLMSELASYSFDRLRGTIVRLFEARATHDLPSSLAAPPSEWSIPYRALAVEVGVDPDLTVGHRLAAAFLDPILVSDPGHVRWDAAAAAWL